MQHYQFKTMPVFFPNLLQWFPQVEVQMSQGEGELSIEKKFCWRVSLLIGLLIAGLVATSVLEPIPQDPGYHRFADSRSYFGIPNFNDVVSNLGFIIVGILGLVIVTGSKRQTIFVYPSDARPYLLFFIAVALVGLGSAYYHWAPSNQRLLWDRLPMSVAFMAFVSTIVADRIHVRAGNSWVLLVLVAAGVASLIYWHWTESLGRGDLRYYGFVQFYPVIVLPVVCWLFPRYRYTAGRYLVWIIVWYAFSKILEHFDGEIFDLSGHTVSGHTLKHLAAAIATFVVLRMLLSQQNESVPDHVP